jgi:pimeloyl-ACP methyl ester carboxylesterase
MRTSRIRLLVAAGVVITVAGCGSSEKSPAKSTGERTSGSASSALASPGDLTKPSLQGTYQAVSGGPKLFIRCFGSGSPAMILLAGTDSAGSVFPDQFVQALAKRQMACTYDRSGRGYSEPPPTDTPRTLDDVADELHGLLAAAKIATPVILVGSSGGGNIAVQYTLRHGDSVAGVALLDVPAPQADLATEMPAGDSPPGPPEYLDWPAAELEQTKLHMPVGTFRLLVVTADGGQSDRADQSYWMGLTPHAEQIVMHGGHDLYQEFPEQVAKEILSRLGAH